MHFIVVLLLVRSHNGSARVWFQPGLFKSVFSKRAHSCLHHGGCILGLSARSSARVSSEHRLVLQRAHADKAHRRPCHRFADPSGVGRVVLLPAHIRFDIGRRGVVTSLKEEHENSASRMFSNDRDCLAPHVHSRRAKGSVRPCRSEMTLDVESVVGGCVS